MDDFFDYDNRVWVYVHGNTYMPYIVTANGDVVRTNWDSFEIFFNNEFTNTEAALQYWG